MFSFLLYAALMGTAGAVALFTVRGTARLAATVVKRRSSGRRRRVAQATPRNPSKDGILYRGSDLGAVFPRAETDYAAYERPTYLRAQGAT